MDRPPLLEGGAAVRCAYALLEGLAAAGVQCTVVCPQEGEPVSAPPGVALELVSIPQQTPAGVRLERLFRPRSRLGSGPFAESVRSMSRDADVVHFVEAPASIGAGLVDRPVLAQLDCLTRLDPRTWNPLRAKGRDSIELLRAERRVVRDAPWLLVNSRELAQAARAMRARVEVSVAPLALHPSHYVPRATVQAPVAGMIGWASWPPTAAAVERLLGSVWPKVLSKRPDAQLLLAGVGMEPSTFPHLPRLDGVQWRGFVPSATGFLRELGVMLYPLTRGSGTKVKVLEALALGIPVVTTPRGREGILHDGGLLTSTDDEQLARHTVELLEDPAARASAGERAHDSFMLGHTPEVAGRTVLEVYERMLA